MLLPAAIYRASLIKGVKMVLGWVTAFRPAWLTPVIFKTTLPFFGTLLLIRQRGRILNWMFDFVARGRHGKNPGLYFLEDDYKPLVGDSAEVFQNDLELEGVLPAELDGVYLRTGPNPQFPPTRGYHWFDGDGLVHATRLKGGKASYASHFVRTSRFKQERDAGKALFMKFGDTVGARGVLLILLDKLRKMLGAIDIKDGDGTANTALTYHAGRLLTLHEGDLPYQIRVMCEGLVDTIGRVVLPAKDGLQQQQFTAHPKHDARTGEMIFFGNYLDKQPHYRVGVMDADGRLTRQWGINTPWPVLSHDICITEHYIVLLHLPLCFEPQTMLETGGLPFVFNTERPSRIGLLRRDSPGGDATDLVRWFELPPFAAFHSINACEDVDGTVKVWACHFDSLSMELDVKGELAKPHLYTLYLETNAASYTKISDVGGDFPVTHPKLVGYPARWAWMGVADPETNRPDFIGIAKLDLHVGRPEMPPDKSSSQPKLVSGKDAVVKRIIFPHGRLGGEAFFVPRSSSEPNTAEEEDDGFLLVYVTGVKDEPTQLHVYDAKTMDPKPIAVVTLPQRVPLGFHGLWISEQQLKDQKPWL